MSRLKVGVIGAGTWGRNHVRTLATMAGVELAAVCDTSEAVRARMAKTYPGALVTASATELLDRVDAVVVASTARTHAELGIAAIRAGKPVLIEKPFALSGADAAAIVAESERAGVPALVGHLLEFHPVIDRLKLMVQDGSLGEVFYLYSQRVNLGQVRPDENALWSFGPHDISVALYLMGEAPVTVSAQGHSYLQQGIEDVVFMVMRFRSGVVAHAHLSWLDPHKERKLTVVGSKQMAVFDDMAPREKLRLYDKGIDRPPEYGSYGESLAVREGDIWIPKIPTAEPLALELAHFVQVARGEAPTRADARDGLRVVQVLEAATRSLGSGGAPVSVEE
ncbi:MAG: Gfo/Idh/MocA family oxidoreductase [Gemmatimonadales bacterium]|nr:Gfo/Idh/MocA family oxidoreductase [Gemmatimonadales bacterium]